MQFSITVTLDDSAADDEIACALRLAGEEAKAYVDRFGKLPVDGEASLPVALASVKDAVLFRPE